MDAVMAFVYSWRPWPPGPMLGSIGSIASVLDAVLVFGALRRTRRTEEGASHRNAGSMF